MRFHVATGASLAFSLAFFLLSASARAVEDDLPVANEPPRIVPVAIADAYYAFHDPAPSTGSATLATSANRHNEIAVNLIAIGAKLEHAKLTGAVVLQAGSSVDALYAGTPTPVGTYREVWKHIQLANVGWRMGDFHVEAGVLPSLVGRESFISTENWNYTRAIMADATPYYLTGLRATWRFIPTMSASLTAFNGWDTHGDRNKHKSGQLRLSWFPSEKFTVDNTVLFGKEESPVEGKTLPTRLFEDLVIGYQLHRRVHLALEGWFGYEKDANVLDRSKGDLVNAKNYTNASFYGGALWAKWQFADTTYVALRGEAVSDPAGIITGRGGRIQQELAAGQNLLAGTATVGWHPHPRLLARVEAAHRVSDTRYFLGGSSEPYVEPLEPNALFTTQARKSSTTFVVSAAFSY